MSRRSVIAVLGLLGPLGGAGCGPMIETPDSGGLVTSTETASTSDAAGTSDGSPPSASSVGSTGTTQAVDDAASSTEDDGVYEEDDGGTGCTFTCPNPPPPTPPPGGGGGGGFDECDIEAQDCPEGEKCMPWANDGGDEWNGTRCSPIAEDPGQPADVCFAEGSATSGIDDCDLGLVCWQVDPKTNQGVCHALCGPGGTCEGGLACDAEGYAPLCVAPCDPLDPASCPPGSACGFFMGTELVCTLAPEGSAAAGEPCDPSTACTAGTLCSYDPALDCGNGPGVGCCAVPCDVDDPAACTGAETCVPWFPFRPPAELAYLGLCAPP